MKVGILRPQEKVGAFGGIFENFMLSLSLPLLFTVSERKFSRPRCTGETKDSWRRRNQPTFVGFFANMHRSGGAVKINAG